MHLKKFIPPMSIILLLVLALIVVASVARGTPPALPPMTEHEKELVQHVEELDAKKDVDGLLQTLKLAGDIRPPRQGEVVGKILTALGHAEPAKLDRPDVIETLKTYAGLGSQFQQAVRILAKIGTEPATAALVSIAGDLKVFWSTRESAVRAIGRIGGEPAVTLILDLFCDTTTRREVRSAACSAIQEDLKLSEAQYRRLLSWVGENGDDDASASVLMSLREKSERVVVPPLLGALNRLRERLDAAEKDPGQAASAQRLGKCFDWGMGSLTTLLRNRAEGLGYEFHYQEPFTVSKGGKVLVSYDRLRYLNSAAERRRVLDFWSAWCQENKVAALPPGWGEKVAGDEYKRACSILAQRNAYQAEKEFRKIVERRAGTPSALLSMKQIFVAQAWAGKMEEALESCVRWRQEELLAAKAEVPKEGPALDALRAQACLDIADACCLIGTAPALKNAKDQLQRLMKDYPQSPLAAAAGKRIEDLDVKIRAELTRGDDREAVTKLVKLFEDAINKGDEEALLSLLAPSADKERERRRMHTALTSDRFRDHSPYSYPVIDVEIDGNLGTAHVETEVKGKDMPAGKKMFWLIRVADGWKFALL